MKKVINAASRKSHKVTFKKKYMIAKKRKEFHRKLKKEKRIHPEKFFKKKKVDSIPGICPFKEDIIVQAQEMKRCDEEEKVKRRELLKEKKKLGKPDPQVIENTRLANLMAEAVARTKQFESRTGVETELIDKFGVADQSAKAYYKEFRKVVTEADVVLEVLDARDPIGTRCTQVEKAVLESGPNKRLVLVLNKADLVPKKNLQIWLKYLRGEFPALAFKASTQAGSNIGHLKRRISRKSKTEEIKSTLCLGAEVLMGLLKNYCRNNGVKTSISVGVVGLPNVGKSSIINSLKRSKSCNVGATPGVTKVRQEIHLDSQIVLLDSPGMVLAAGSKTDASIALRNAIKIEDLQDYSLPVEAILSRTNRKQMMSLYDISDYTSTNEFLILLAKRFGKLRKGGVYDTRAAACLLLQHWNSGRIRYHTEPPETRTDQLHVSAEIVSQMAAEFDIEALEDTEKEDMNRLPLVVSDSPMVLQTAGMVTEVEEGDVGMDTEAEEGDQDEPMQEEDDGGLLSTVVVDVPTTSTKKKKIQTKEKKKDEESVLEGNVQLKKRMKLAKKKEKKKNARREHVSTELSANLESALSSLGGENDDDEYNFETDFTFET